MRANSNKKIQDPEQSLDKILTTRKHKILIPQGKQSQNLHIQPNSQLCSLKKSVEKCQKSPIPQLNSSDIAQALIHNQKATTLQIKQQFKKLSQIKTLKYDKFSEKIRLMLIETMFNNSYPKFTKIIEAYDTQICSTHLLHSIFNGFQQIWLREKINDFQVLRKLLNFYIEKIPDCLNKRFIKFVKQIAIRQKDSNFLKEIKEDVLRYLQKILKIYKQRKNKYQKNEKLLALALIFELQDKIRMNELIKYVPLQRVNQYIDKHNQELKIVKEGTEIQKEKQIKFSQKKQQRMPLLKKKTPTIIHHAILELIEKNNLKEIEKILKLNDIYYRDYPTYVKKLETKYLEYILRTNPIYVIDELISGKISLIQNAVDMYMKRKKYQQAEHFINKYKLRGIDTIQYSKIFKSPLVEQDSFGPTQSYVLNQKSFDCFLSLKDFNIRKPDVLWIDTLTIYQKSYIAQLLKLIKSPQVSLDSQSTTGIHPFQLGTLQLIQIYQPLANKVFLFDFQDFKNRKIRKILQKKEFQQKKTSNSDSISNNIPINQQTKKQRRKSFEKTMEIQNQKYHNDKNQKDQNRTWFRFTRIIQNLFKNATIYGHALHTDLGDIIQELQLKVNVNQVSIKDSQCQFKKYYPQQTKSSLNYLAEKCLGKSISKYEQCSAWNKRPLRKAQKHYAALDAVLPYKLVKLFEQQSKDKVDKII